jgi:hypothetical protein
LLFADRVDFFSINKIDAHPAGVLAVEQPVLVLPLRFQIEPAEREPEAIVREGNRVDAAAKSARSRSAWTVASLARIAS